MRTQIEIIRKARSFVLGMVNDMSDDQLNKIPPGYKNNIIWNMGHLIASQQDVCYIRSNVSIVVDEGYIKLFKSDTKPQGIISSDAIDTIKKLLLPTIDRLESDYKQHMLTSFKPFKTRYGVSLQTIDDAINYLVFHEGIHVGYIMALKKIV
ncbi:DinB family protein [Cytophaga aurantiaca]|uniref:DinB family protein n=1 Tax=Cytophaga aurantiaca TaxID=29530 RepID=UPI00035DADA2|nr:DinB family protein [Cytophaga aurantiaca]